MKLFVYRPPNILSKLFIQLFKLFYVLIFYYNFIFGARYPFLIFIEYKYYKLMKREYGTHAESFPAMK